MSETFEMESMIRGKRSKRQRPTSPISLTMPNSSSSSTTTSSNPTSGSWSTEEEEDMAHCLILLAQGQTGPTGKQEPESEIPASSENPRSRLKVVGSDNNLLLTSYQCKTCDRSFPSFQALGGHRASHKIKAKEVSGKLDPQNRGTISKQSISTTALTLEIPNRVVSDCPAKSKVHECTICGLEFASGQALGGHMRRHRALPGPNGPTNPDAAKKQRTAQLGLDLNLPAAPEEELREAKNFPAAAREQVILFSASPLVDCCRY